MFAEWTKPGAARWRELFTPLQSFLIRAGRLQV